ncbi:ATP-binding protein [Neobacillus sp. NPDC058068]|uniref:ATP-binding protein n=1 Tax=Neobacillus sp. NPDC058068 TaxID=3346325 RepID=UPI0036DF395F
METLTSISDDCPYRECDGTGLIWIKDNKENREFMRECRCKEIKALERKLRGARIPDEFKQTTINSFDINLYTKQESKERAITAKRIAGNYVKKFPLMVEQGKGLYLFSKTKGSGKTRLAASIMNALLQVHDTKENPLSIYYSPAADLLAEIKRTFGEESPVSSSDIIDAVKGVDVLILDDIGVEKVSDWVEETFTRILDYRLQHKKVTIFTSNLELDELDEKYPQGRISSRIEKMTFPVKMPDEKIRSLLAQKENEDLLDLLLE